VECPRATSHIEPPPASYHAQSQMPVFDMWLQCTSYPSPNASAHMLCILSRGCCMCSRRLKPESCLREWASLLVVHPVDIIPVEGLCRHPLLELLALLHCRQTDWALRRDALHRDLARQVLEALMHTMTTASQSCQNNVHQGGRQRPNQPPPLPPPPPGQNTHPRVGCPHTWVPTHACMEHILCT